MRERSTVRIYCEVVFIAACIAMTLLLPFARLHYIIEDPITFGILAAGVVLGEMLPIKIPRRGDDEELTLSASFAIAVLLIGGLGPALIAQGVASVLQDLHSGKPGWRIRFNLGQYTLSMVAAWAVIRAISFSSRLDVLHPFESRQLPALMIAAAVFFLVNACIVGTAVALYQRVPIVGYFRNNLSFVVITGGVVLLVSPIVLAAAAYTVVIVPLCLAPVVAMYNSVSQSARS